MLGDDLRLNLIHVNMLSASGNENWKRCEVNLKKTMVRERCFIPIKNRD